MPALVKKIMKHPTPQSDSLALRMSDEEAGQVAATKKDPQAFGVLFDRYFQPIYRYLLSRVGDVEEAQDLASQTFLTAFEALPRYQHRGFFSAWIFSIARSKYIDFIRKSSRSKPSGGEPEPVHFADPLHQIIETERTRDLYDLIRVLPGEEQELLRLRYASRLSFNEVAMILGRNEDAVKISVYRLLARLQSQLEEKHE
jgi:RNA polymerase sigma factor (sigma-70 family)